MILIIFLLFLSSSSGSRAHFVSEPKFLEGERESLLLLQRLFAYYDHQAALWMQNLASSDFCCQTKVIINC